MDTVWPGSHTPPLSHSSCIYQPFQSKFVSLSRRAHLLFVAGDSSALHGAWYRKHSDKSNTELVMICKESITASRESSIFCIISAAAKSSNFTNKESLKNQQRKHPTCASAQKKSGLKGQRAVCGDDPLIKNDHCLTWISSTLSVQ